MCPASSFTGILGGFGEGELARFVDRIALSAQQHRTHAVKGVRGVEPKMANIRQGPVSTGLGLQPAEDLRWVGLLDEQRADLTLYGVVGRIGVRPGKAMAMDVLSGHKLLQSRPMPSGEGGLKPPLQAPLKTPLRG